MIMIFINNNEINTYHNMKRVMLTESDLHRIIMESVNIILMTENYESVEEDEVSFVDKDFFGDDEEHWYDCKCNDGTAIGRLSFPEEDHNAPDIIKISYPKLSQILRDEQAADEILQYRGLSDLGPDEINFGDIMMKYGKIIG